METTSVEDMFAHMEWADSLVWDAMLATPDGAGDERLLGTLRHLHLVQRAFLGVWCVTLGAPLGEALDHHVDPEGLTSAPQVRDWARRYYPWARDFLDDLDTADLDRAVEMPWAAAIEERLGRPPGPTTLRETMYQVAAHSMHHRGQVCRRIRELGGEPPLTDYIAWLWMGRPEPRW